MRSSPVSGSKSERDCLRALLSKQLLPLALLLVFAWLIIQKSQELDFQSIFQAVHAITPVQWTTAIAAAAVSFWAIGRMDLVIHRLLGTGISDTTAQLSGIASVATAQLTGFGLLTGTLARWRVLPDVSLWKAAQITGAVSASFMIALGVLASAMVVVVGPEIMWSRPIAAIALCATLGLVAATLWRPRRLLRAKLPPLKAQASLLGFALLDTGAAALTLYVLIPEAYMPPPALFYTIFLLALGAGLLGTTPGGVGPFEMLFLACLPNLPDAPILAAIMGYRLVYFALPACLAAALLIAGPMMSGKARPPGSKPKLLKAKSEPGSPIAQSALIYNAARAESGLIRQGDFDILLDEQDRPMSLVAQAGQSLIMFADPINSVANPNQVLKSLSCIARQKYLSPCLYKCSAELAAMARRSGWHVIKIAAEAKIDPARFDLSSSNTKQLRRLLRKAAAANVTIRDSGPRIPFDALQDIAQQWSKHRGGARGFSMGLFDETYITGQRVYLAEQNQSLIGFITLHEAWKESCLDLICVTPTAPAGTSQALITHAILAAKDEDREALSLAAVPAFTDMRALPAWATEKLNQYTHAPGLTRFKSAFAPQWQPLYLAAPTYAALAMAGLDLTDRITRPRSNSESNS